MHIAVIGAGSMGLLIAGNMAAAGCEVTLFTRTSGAGDVLRKAGVTVSGLTIHTAVPVKTAMLRDAAAACDAEWAVVTVKQTHLTDSFFRLLTANFYGKTKFLFIQNGIGHAVRFASYTAADRIFIAVTTEGARKRSEHEVSHTGTGETWIGAFTENRVSDQPSAYGEAEKNLINAFERAGFRTFWSDDMENKAWEKLLINAVINPLTAILRIPNGGLLLSQERIHLMRKLYEEGVQAGQAVGIAFAPDLWERVQNVCRLTAPNYSSMLQDVRAGRPTEIEAITGSLLRTAEQSGIELHTHRTILDLIRSLERMPESER